MIPSTGAVMAIALYQKYTGLGIGRGPFLNTYFTWQDTEDCFIINLVLDHFLLIRC